MSAPDIGDLPIESLLQRRADAAAVIAAIDEALERRGLRATAKTPRRSRSGASAVLALLALRGEATTKEIRAVTPLASSHALDQLLHVMAKAGEIERTGRGRFRLAKSAQEKAE